MSETSPNGGPAFPRPFSFRHEDDQHRAQSGMTLRDWFAGQALAIVHRRFDEGSELCLEDIAMQAYFIADAMLNERDETS